MLFNLIYCSAMNFIVLIKSRPQLLHLMSHLLWGTPCMVWLMWLDNFTLYQISWWLERQQEYICSPWSASADYFQKGIWQERCSAEVQVQIQEIQEMSTALGEHFAKMETSALDPTQANMAQLPKNLFQGKSRVSIRHWCGYPYPPKPSLNLHVHPSSSLQVLMWHFTSLWLYLCTSLTRYQIGVPACLHAHASSSLPLSSIAIPSSAKMSSSLHQSSWYTHLPLGSSFYSLSGRYRSSQKTKMDL